MPLPGGASDKIPNRYEKRWTVYCLIKLLMGEFEAIHLESPKEDKAEFILFHNQDEYYHQAKRQRSTGTWTLSGLRSEGLLQAFGEMINKPHSFWVFVSGHATPAIRELTENARSANSFAEFDEQFVPTSKDRQENFDELCKEWKTSRESAFELLKRITTITVDEHMLIELNRSLITHFYSEDDADAVISMLGTFIDDQIHKKVVAQDIWTYLAEKLSRIDRKTIDQPGISEPIPGEHIQQILLRDLEQISNLLSEMMDKRLEVIDQARRQGKADDFLDELRTIEASPTYARALTNQTRVRLLCLLAAVELDLNDDVDRASQLVDMAESLNERSERPKRMRAWILGYKQHNLPEALQLLNETDEISSKNLSAAILIDQGCIEDARDILITLPQPDAETYRLLTIIAIRKANLEEARLNIAEAKQLQPEWQNVKSLVAVVEYMGTLTDLAITELAKTYPAPPLLHQALITLNKQSVHTYRSVARQFEVLVPENSNAVSLPHIWCLACLIYHPALHDEAEQYCQHLLSLDPTNVPTIVWSLSQGMPVDLFASRHALANLDGSGEIERSQILVLADLYSAEQQQEQVLQLLETHRLKFEGVSDRIEWLTRYVDVMLSVDQAEALESLLSELELDTEEKYKIEAEILKYRASIQSDFVPLIQHLEQRYEATHSSADLVPLCLVLRSTEQWELLRNHTDELLESVLSSFTVWLAIEAFYHTGDFEHCLDLLTQYQKDFEAVVSDVTLRTLSAACYEAIGELKEAIRIMQGVLSRTKAVHDLLNLAHLYFKIGDRTSLDLLSTQLDGYDVPDGSVHLNFAHLLRKRNPERAIRLWREADRLGIPDELVSFALFLTIELGLYEEGIRLQPRFASLAQRGIGGQVISPQVLLDMKRDDDRLFAEFRTEYQTGRIPVHSFVDNTLTPLIAPFYFNFRANENETMFRADAIFARHGSRILSEIPPERLSDITLSADISSILLAYHLGALNEISRVFGPIYLAQDVIQVLALMEEQMRDRVQSERAAAQAKIHELIDRDRIHIFETVNFRVPDEMASLRSELRPSEVALLHAANTNGGYYIDFLPLTKFSDDLEIVPAKIPNEWIHLIAGRSDVLEALQHHIPHKKYQEAARKFQQDRDPSKSQILETGINLYFDGNAIEEFARADIIDDLCNHFTVIIRFC